MKYGTATKVRSFTLIVCLSMLLYSLLYPFLIGPSVFSNVYLHQYQILLIKECDIEAHDSIYCLENIVQIFACISR